MNIADLFVTLGIKGTEKTVGALGTVKKGMGEVASTSLEAKAAIVGAMYGLERMMAISGAMGTNLTNLSSGIEMSKKNIQQWDYAARQAGMANGEMESSLKSLHDQMSAVRNGKSAPEGMALIAKATGGFDIERLTDTLYMAQKVRDALKIMSVPQGNMAAKSMGFSDGAIAAARRGLLDESVLKKAPTYGDSEIKSLDKSNIAWANLGNKVEMAFGHFNSKHGQQMVSDISKVVDSVVRLAEAFTMLSERVKVFQGMSKVFEGWAAIFNGISGAVNEVGNDKEGGAHGLVQKAKDFAGGAVDVYKGMQIEAAEQSEKSLQARVAKYKNGSILAPGPGPVPSTVVNNNNTSLNQNIVHHGDAKDTGAVRDTHKTAINHAYRQRSAQRQAN